MKYKVTVQSTNADHDTSQSERVEFIDAATLYYPHTYTQMSQMIREQIEFQLIAFQNTFDTLTFQFDVLHSSIETSLHHQIALNYAHAIIDDENNDYVVNAIARNEHENATLFEIVETQTMQTMRTFEITRNLQINDV